MYDMRSASAGTSPIVMRLAVIYGKPSLLRSSSQTRLSKSRARGPHSPMQHCAVVASVTRAEPSCGMPASIHAKSCSPIAPPVTTMNRSSSSRVTVRSHLIPPLGVSIEVYVMLPTGLFMRFVASRSNAPSAPAPAISNLANGVMSNIATRSRAATCSAATVGDHSRAAQPVRSAPLTVSESSKPSLASYHCGRSHPAFSKNTASSACCRGKNGVRRRLRGRAICCRGWMMS